MASPASKILSSNIILIFQKTIENCFMAAVKSHRSFPALWLGKDRIALQIESLRMRGAGCEGIRPIKTLPCIIELEYNRYGQWNQKPKRRAILSRIDRACCEMQLPPVIPSRWAHGMGICPPSEGERIAAPALWVRNDEGRAFRNTPVSGSLKAPAESYYSSATRFPVR